MNKKNNRKGFTIVELVIVIAVIAILATVLVPTFGNVIADAKNTALVQQIKNEHTNYTMENATKDDYSEEVYIKIGSKYYHFVNGSIEMNGEVPVEYSAVPATKTIYDASNNTVSTQPTAAAGGAG